MKKISFIFNAGISFPVYLAHLTIGIGGHTLWFSITTRNWNKIQLRKEGNPFLPKGACLSIFTVSYTN